MIFKRPWLVLLLFVFVLIFTVSAWARVWQGVQLWGFLSGLAISVTPWVQVSLGAVWGIFGLAAAVMIWWGNPRSPVFVITGSVVYSVYFWVEQLFMMVSPLRRVNWPFLIIFNLIVVLTVVLCFRYPLVRRFYGGRYE